MATPSRIFSLDLLRILAVFLVVLVHSLHVPNAVTAPTIASYVLFAFAKICVPLFIMISGALLLGKKEPTRVFFQKRGMRILFPWLSWSLILFWLEGGAVGVSHIFLTRFWFLPLIASLYLLTPFLRAAVQHLNRWELLFTILLWFLSVSVLPYFLRSEAFPLASDNGLVRQTVLYIGYYLLGYVLLKQKLPGHVVRFAVVGIVLGIFGPLWAALYLPTEPLRFFDYTSPVIVLTTVSVFLFVTGRFRQNSRTHSVVPVLADAAFGIIFVHEIINIFLLRTLGEQNGGVVSDLLHAGSVFLLSLGIVIIIRQTKLKTILT